MCGVCACVNRQKSVSHGETMRVGSSVSYVTGGSSVYPNIHAGAYNTIARAKMPSIWMFIS